MTRLRNQFASIAGFFMYYLIRLGFSDINVAKIDLCGGGTKIPEFFNVDINPNADLVLDLERSLLPFASNSADTVVCISAINYFTRERGQRIIRDVYRVLKPAGVARFGVQDLRTIANKYLDADEAFFNQKLPNGKERFRGDTMADKINSWFSGYRTIGNKHVKYFYDFETLALLFRKAGFSKIQEKKYLDSFLENIDLIDNRSDQMFFLEAIK